MPAMLFLHFSGPRAAHFEDLRSRLGMTWEEVEKYIAQVAFSGAEEFLRVYQTRGAESYRRPFWLGFFSAYIVAEKVEPFRIERGRRRSSGPATVRLAIQPGLFTRNT